MHIFVFQWFVEFHFQNHQCEIKNNICILIIYFNMFKGGGGGGGEGVDKNIVIIRSTYKKTKIVSPPPQNIYK